MAWFGKCFRRCSVLQELLLNYCQLGDDGLLGFLHWSRTWAWLDYTNLDYGFRRVSFPSAICFYISGLPCCRLFVVFRCVRACACLLEICFCNTEANYSRSVLIKSGTTLQIWRVDPANDLPHRMLISVCLCERRFSWHPPLQNRHVSYFGSFRHHQIHIELSEFTQAHTKH